MSGSGGVSNSSFGLPDMQPLNKALKKKECP